MKTTQFVSIVYNYLSFNVVVPATLSEIADTLKTKYSYCHDVKHNEVATALLHRFGPTSRLAYEKDKNNEHEIVISLAKSPFMYSNVKVYGQNGMLVFNSSFGAFCDWVKADPVLKAAVGKIIRFNYAGGSAPGIRVVKVSSIDGSGESTLIKGLDCSKGEFRSYKKGEIMGKVEILN